MVPCRWVPNYFSCGKHQILRPGVAPSANFARAQSPTRLQLEREKGEEYVAALPEPHSISLKGGFGLDGYLPFFKRQVRGSKPAS